MDSDRKNPLVWKPRRVEGILRQEADGMAVLLELKSGRYYSLNATGSRIWDLCDGTRSGADIARRLGEEYGTPLSTVETDVAALLTEFACEKLVCDC